MLKGLLIMAAILFAWTLSASAQQNECIISVESPGCQALALKVGAALSAADESYKAERWAEAAKNSKICVEISKDVSQIGMFKPTYVVCSVMLGQAHLRIAGNSTSIELNDQNVSVAATSFMAAIEAEPRMIHHYGIELATAMASFKGSEREKNLTSAIKLLETIMAETKEGSDAHETAKKNLEVARRMRNK